MSDINISSNAAAASQWLGMELRGNEPTERAAVPAVKADIGELELMDVAQDVIDVCHPDAVRASIESSPNAYNRIFASRYLLGLPTWEVRKQSADGDPPAFYRWNGNGESETVERIQAVILLPHTVYRLYKGRQWETEMGARSVPSCGAIKEDRKAWVGVGDPGGSCAQCPVSKYERAKEHGSRSINGDVNYCREGVRLYVATLDSGDVTGEFAVINMQRMPADGLTAFAEWLKAQKDAGHPVQTDELVVELTLSPHPTEDERFQDQPILNITPVGLVDTSDCGDMYNDTIVDLQEGMEKLIGSWLEGLSVSAPESRNASIIGNRRSRVNAADEADAEDDDDLAYEAAAD